MCLLRMSGQSEERTDYCWKGMSKCVCPPGLSAMVTCSGQLPPPPSQQCPSQSRLPHPSERLSAILRWLLSTRVAVTLRVSAVAAEDMGSEGEALWFQSWLRCLLALLTFSGLQFKMRIITMFLSGLDKLIHMKVYWSRFSQ